MALTSLELFAGAGGLAMGASLAGFRSHGVVEWDKWACDTVRQNQGRGYPLVADWPLFDAFRCVPRYAAIQKRIDASIARERAVVLAFK